MQYHMMTKSFLLKEIQAIWLCYVIYEYRKYYIFMQMLHVCDLGGSRYHLRSNVKLPFVWLLFKSIRIT